MAMSLHAYAELAMWRRASSAARALASKWCLRAWAVPAAACVWLWCVRVHTAQPPMSLRTRSMRTAAACIRMSSAHGSACRRQVSSACSRRACRRPRANVPATASRREAACHARCQRRSMPRPSRSRRSRNVRPRSERETPRLTRCPRQRRHARRRWVRSPANISTRAGDVASHSHAACERSARRAIGVVPGCHRQRASVSERRRRCCMSAMRRCCADQRAQLVQHATASCVRRPRRTLAGASISSRAAGTLSTARHRPKAMRDARTTLLKRKTACSNAGGTGG